MGDLKRSESKPSRRLPKKKKARVDEGERRFISTHKKKKKRNQKKKKVGCYCSDWPHVFVHRHIH